MPTPAEQITALIARLDAQAEVVAQDRAAAEALLGLVTAPPSGGGSSTDPITAPRFLTGAGSVYGPGFAFAAHPDTGLLDYQGSGVPAIAQGGRLQSYWYGDAMGPGHGGLGMPAGQGIVSQRADQTGPETGLSLEGGTVTVGDGRWGDASGRLTVAAVGSRQSMALRNDEPTTFVRIALAPGVATAGEVLATVRVHDATGAKQVCSARVAYAAVNVGGSITVELSPQLTALPIEGAHDATFDTESTDTDFGLCVTSTTSLTATAHVIDYLVLQPHPAAVTPLSVPFAFVCLGDSKTHEPDVQWPSWLAAALNAAQDGIKWEYAAVGVNLATVASTAAAIESRLAAMNPTHPVVAVLVCLGTNELTHDPDETAWKADYQTILDAVNTKWPDAKILLTKPAHALATSAQIALLAGWIDDVVVANVGVAEIGDDESVWFLPSTATLSLDEVHQNTPAGQVAKTEQARLLIARRRAELGY